MKALLLLLVMALAVVSAAARVAHTSSRFIRLIQSRAMPPMTCRK